MEDDELVLYGIRMISMLKPGETYNISTRSIVTHNSWYGWFTRTINDENKLKLETWIIQNVSNLISKYRNRKSPYILQTLKELKNGILSLHITYIDCKEVNFIKIRDDIDAFLNKEGEHHEYYNYFCSTNRNH